MTPDFDPKTLRKSLDALRAKHGADTPIGHRCSNLIEILKNLPDATGEAKAALEKSLTKAVADIERLSAPNAEACEPVENKGCRQ